MNELLTEDQFKAALPKKVKGSVNKEVIDGVNELLSNPDLREMYRENILSYTSVLMDGKYKIQDYVNAVAYVSNKLMGDSNVTSYSKVFPDRIQRLVDKGASDKEISSYVSAYNKGQLINKIWEQTLVPIHVLNSDLHQKAINVLATEMVSARNDMARVTAAKALIEATKPPETAKIELDIKHDSGEIQDMKTIIAELAANQLNHINLGLSTVKQIAEKRIVNQVIDEGEFI